MNELVEITAFGDPHPRYIWSDPVWRWIEDWEWIEWPWPGQA